MTPLLYSAYGKRRLMEHLIHALYLIVMGNLIILAGRLMARVYRLIRVRAGTHSESEV